jgi:hypothetical protein
MAQINPGGSPLILSFSPWEKGRLNKALSLQHRSLSQGERDRVRGDPPGSLRRAPMCLGGDNAAAERPAHVRPSIWCILIGGSHTGG